MAERDPDCLFCKIVAGELPATIVAEDDRTVSFMDINPATRGHALVVPREHATDLLGIILIGSQPARRLDQPLPLLGLDQHADRYGRGIVGRYQGTVDDIHLQHGKRVG